MGSVHSLRPIAPEERALTRYVLIGAFCKSTGYTRSAVEAKIARGEWVAGHHFKKAPDGHIHIDLDVYEAWVEGRAEIARRNADGARR